MTNREHIEREGYRIIFVKKPTKIVAIAVKDTLNITAEGKDQARALSRLKVVVLKKKGDCNGQTQKKSKQEVGKNRRS